MEIKQHLIQNKYDDLMRTKQSMVSSQSQTNSTQFTSQGSSQTQIIVKYDKQLQAALIDDSISESNSKEL
jgi:hypothetical protein